MPGRGIPEGSGKKPGRGIDPGAISRKTGLRLAGLLRLWYDKDQKTLG